MTGGSAQPRRPVRPPPLIWAGVALIGAGGLVEGAATGTAYGHRFRYAALAAVLAILAGAGLLLLGYHRQLGRAGLPPKPAFFLWATLGLVAFTAGWANLRGVVHHLNESVRDVVVAAGVTVGLACQVVAVFSFARWWRRLDPEERALLWRMTQPWLAAVAAVAVAVGVGGSLFHRLATGQPH